MRTKVPGQMRLWRQRKEKRVVRSGSTSDRPFRSQRTGPLMSLVGWAPCETRGQPRHCDEGSETPERVHGSCPGCLGYCAAIETLMDSASLFIGTLPIFYMYRMIC